MLCNLPQYKEKEELIRQTWAKPVLDKEIEGVDLYFFTSGDENKIDNDNHKIYVKASDLRDRTFQKVMKTIELVNENNIEYDYIVRVNVSTYLNVRLLREVIQNSPESSYLYSGTVFMQPWICNKLPFMSGEYLVLSKANIDIALDFYHKNIDHFNKLENDPRTDTKWVCDDGWFTIAYSKFYQGNYLNNLHSLGLVFLNGKSSEGLKYEKEIRTWPAICYKTCSLNEDIDLDRYPVYDEEDKAKLLMIHEYVQKNEINDLRSWYINYIIDIYDSACYSYQSVVKTQKGKRIFEERINKHQLVDNYVNKK